MRSQLDKDKLVKLLKLNKKSRSWLADNLGWTRQRLHYHLKNNTVKLADASAPLFGLKGKDLIK